MLEMFACGKTLPEAYHDALVKLNDFGQIYDCHDWNTRQKECSITMIVCKPLCEPMISKLFFGDPESLEQYRQEMLDGILDFEIEKGKWAYTYHDRIASQIPRIIEILRENPDSRRAYIDIRRDHDLEMDDPPCLTGIQYFIRNDELDCKVLFRSNDAVKATFMNAFALIMLQKRVADELGVKMGRYIHRANSFHAYESDWKALDANCKRIMEWSHDSLVWNYEGDWKEQMEEVQPDIARKVEELKLHK